MFSEDGIIKQAQRTAGFQANAEASDQGAMNTYDQYIANSIPQSGENGGEPVEPETPTWEYDQASQTVTNGTITLNIGDYVNYNPQEGATKTSYTSEQANNGYGKQVFTLSEYIYGWRVLGVNKQGQLLLIAEDFVQPSSGGYTDSKSGRKWLYIRGQYGYVNGVNELNNICAIYGQGKEAVGARSVNVTDINNITGYDPEATGDGNPYKSGAINEYGNKVTYTLTNGVVNYLGTKYPTKSTSSSETTFTYYTGSEWKTLTAGESAELTSYYYKYYPNTLTDSSTADTEPGILTDSTAYKMLFTNSSTGAYSAGNGATSQFYYWLADPYIGTYAGNAYFGVRLVKDGSVRQQQHVLLKWTPKLELLRRSSCSYSRI